jgi:hypothetical protein
MDVKTALASGLAAINAWAAGEQAKIHAVKEANINTDPTVSSLTAELSHLSIGGPPGAAQFFGVPVVLRSAHQKLLTTDGHGFTQGPLERKDPKYHWYLEDQGGGKFTLSNIAHDTRLCASDNKLAVTPTKNRAGWEHFTLNPTTVAPEIFTISTAHGTFLAISPDGKLYQNASVGGWEYWAVEPVVTKRELHEQKIAAARAAAARRAEEIAHKQAADLHTEVLRRQAEKQALAARLEGELRAEAKGAEKFYGAVIEFTDAHGALLSSEGGGASFNHTKTPGPNTSWVLEPAGPPGKFFISCPATDTRICASDNKSLVTPTKNRSGWEIFSLNETTVAPTVYTISTPHGGFLALSPQGLLYQNGTVGGWEYFHVKFQGGSLVHPKMAGQLAALAGP